MQVSAIQFFERYKAEFTTRHRKEIVVLETVSDVTRFEDPEVAKFLKSKFYVKMSRYAYTLLKYQVEFNCLYLIAHIMNLNLQFDISSEFKVALDQTPQAILVPDLPPAQNESNQTGADADGL